MSDDIFRVPFRSDFLPLSGVKYGLTFWGGVQKLRQEDSVLCLLRYSTKTLKLSRLNIYFTLKPRLSSLRMLFLHTINKLGEKAYEDAKRIISEISAIINK